MALINKDNVNKFAGLEFNKDILLFQNLSKEISDCIDRRMIKRLIELGFYSNDPTKEKSDQD